MSPKADNLNPWPQAAQRSAAVAAGAILSFDVEEYFQVEAAADTVTPQAWDCFSHRLQEPLDRILQLLSDYRCSATFFILGWVARNEPELVRRIAHAGHEIASHGYGHVMLTRLGPEQFRRDLIDSRMVLEDVCSCQVIGYRAPTFSVMHETAWALDVLAETGFTYDSSIFPIRHDRYGVPEAPPVVHRAVGPGGGSLIEIPPLTMRMLGANIPLGGGGYLRVLPARLALRHLRKRRRQGFTSMIYLHPWELDPLQPDLPMSCWGRWRHRVGMHRTERKLKLLLDHVQFTCARNVLGHLAAEADLQTFHYGRND